MIRCLARCCVAVAVLLALNVAHSRTYSRGVPYPACLQFIADTAERLKQAPINIVETSEIRVVRFRTADGSILMTCSRPDEKLTMTESAKR